MNGIDLNLPSQTQLYARRFVESKRRLPESQMELYEWLLEFNAAMIKLLDSWENLYKEHLMLCNRPIIIDNSGRSLTHDDGRK